MKKLFLALILMATAVTAHAASTNMVVNGSFEATKQGNNSWTIYKDSSAASALPGWTSGKLGIEVRNNAVGKASDGYNFVELDTTGNSFMSQIINHTSSVGSYFLTFDYQNRSSTAFDTNGLSWQFGNVTGVAPSFKDYAWHTFNAKVVGLSGSTELKFSAAGTSDSYGSSIDNVSVKVVPIPGAVWMFGSGLVGLVAAQRRKSNSIVKAV